MTLFFYCYTTYDTNTIEGKNINEIKKNIKYLSGLRGKRNYINVFESITNTSKFVDNRLLGTYEKGRKKNCNLQF